MLSLSAWTTFKLFVQEIPRWDKRHYSWSNLCSLPGTHISPAWADSRRYSPSVELPLWAFSQPPQLQHCFADSTVCCQRSFKTWFSPLKSPTGHGLCPQALQGRHTASPQTFLNTASVPKTHQAWLDLLLLQISHRRPQHPSHAQPVCPWDFCRHKLINHASWDIVVASVCTFQGAPPLTPFFQTFPASTSAPLKSVTTL